MYEQAFHTCCRDGLTTPTLAFQFKAASPGLSNDRLTALARLMIGYVPPPSAPPAPNNDELAEFPKSLRYLDVNGVGPCVAQTVYVGREDRAASGEGHGRFGNYFSHVVAAVNQPAFDERRHPIEMWGSALWRTDGSAASATAVATVPSGPISLDGALDAITDPARLGWLPVIFDSLGAVMSDRARIVVLDDGAHAWAWVAAVTLILPLGISRALTFDTYTGEPDRSTARLLVSDPSVERASLARKVLTGELVLVDLERPAPAPSGLLGRAVAEHLGTVERLRSARDAMSDDLHDVDEVAVVVASAGEHPVTLLESDLPLVLDVFARWLRHPDAGQARIAAIATLLDRALDEGIGLAALASDTITSLIDEARRHVELNPSAAATVLRIALRRPELVSGAGLVLQDHDAASAAIGDAIALISDADAPLETVLTNLSALDALGLVGANTALDRRIGRAAARFIDRPEIAEWLDAAAGRPGTRRVAESAIKAAAAAENVSPELLRRLGRPPLRQVLTGLAADDQDFIVLEARALTAVDPTGRARYLTAALSRIDSDSGALAVTRALYGRSTVGLREITEMIDVWQAAGRQPTASMMRAAWEELDRLDPMDEIANRKIVRLVNTLKALDPDAPTGSFGVALWLAQERKRGLKPWYDEIVRRRHDLNAAHIGDILSGLAHELADTHTHTDADHEEVVADALATFGDRFTASYKREVGMALARSLEPRLPMRVFVTWLSRSIPERPSEEMIDEFLPSALRDWHQADRDRIGAMIEHTHGHMSYESWLEWCEQHPPHGVIGRSVGRLFRRRPE